MTSSHGLLGSFTVLTIPSSSDSDSLGTPKTMVGCATVAVNAVNKSTIQSNDSMNEDGQFVDYIFEPLGPLRVQSGVP